MSTTKASKYHGKRFMFPGTANKAKFRAFVNRLPKRTDFIDKVAAKKIAKKVATEKPILFHPNDLLEQHYRDGKGLKYKLLLMGILRSGEKAAVVLNNIEVFFYVRVPDDAEPNKFAQAVRKALKNEEIYYKKIEERECFPFKEFHEEPVPYLRITFATLHARKKALKYLRSDQIKYWNNEDTEKHVEVETAFDDMTCYYRMVARECKFKLAGWNVLRKYKIVEDNKYTKPECYSYTFEVDVEKFVDMLTTKIDASKHDDIKKDKSMVMEWDLETDDLEPTGNAPMPDDVFNGRGEPRAVIEIDCCSFHWQYSTDDLLTIAITVMPAPPRPDCLTIQVRNQTDLMKVKALVGERMAPDFVTGFNDGSYDWPFINRRIEMYDLMKKTKLVEFMKRHLSTIPYTSSNAKWAIRGIKEERRIKVEADSYLDIEVFDVPGFICIDTRTIFRQLFPTAEKTSLNFFLAINKLGSKADMDYLVMFKIFRLMRQLIIKYKTRDYKKIHSALMVEIAEHGELYCPLKQTESNPAPKFDDSAYNVTKLNCKDILALVEQCTDVIHYCNVDAKRCQELLCIRNVIPDKREIVNLSYTSMYDAFYRAGGMKVRNMVLGYAVLPEWNLAGSNISTNNKDPRKYPGAYVVPPEKGLYRDHKIAKRRRRQLMKNVALADQGIGNIQKFDIEEVSPDCDKFREELLDDDQYGLDDDMPKKVKFISNDTNDKSDRPCTGLDFSSLYPSLIMTYNLSPEKIVLSKEEADRLKAKGYNLHYIEFHYKLEGQAESEDTLRTGWSVRHKATKNVSDDGKVDWTYEGMGIYPFILKFLFDERKKMKKQMHHYAVPKEYMEDVMDRPEFEALGEDADAQREFVAALLEKDIAEKQEIVDAQTDQRKRDYYGYQLYCVKAVKKFLIAEGFLGSEDSEPSGITFQELYPEVSFYFNYFNSKQLALKVFMNTFYGETGNSLSPFFIVQVAGGITSSGQYNIKMVKGRVLKRLYAVKYGDSITADMPVMLLIDGEIIHKPVKSLDEMFNSRGVSYHGDKQAFELENAFIWSENGWTKIHRFIRHQTNKAIYEVRCSAGVVRVTEDHGMLLADGTEIRPNDLVVGKSMLMLANNPYGEFGFGDGIVKSVTKIRKNTGEWVYDFTTDNHHFMAGIGRIVVHNTDSLYICCPESCFEKCDADYVSGRISRLEYWTRMIEISMETMDDFKDEVNALLEADNGTPFLKMAYEEVLWPYAMVGKKKYIGVKHEGIVNLAICMPECTLRDFMKSKSLFIRGLEVKKRGASEFLKQLCFEVVKDAFCITQTMTLKEIVEHKIGDVTNRQWAPDLFIRTARYKKAAPGKPGNVTVHSFANRMGALEVEHPELGIKRPELGERFRYVVSKKFPWTYGRRGKQTNIKIGDKYEYFESLTNKAYQAYLGEDLEVDIDYYMMNEVIGQFARFVVYHPYYDKFGVDKPVEEWTDDDYKAADKKAVTFAKKEMQKYYKSNFATQYEKRGKLYQGVFKTVNKRVSEMHYDQYGDAATLFDVTSTLTTGADIGGGQFADARLKRALRERIMKEATKIATKDAQKRVSERVKKMSNTRRKDGISIYDLYSVYVTGKNAIFPIQREILNANLAEAETILKEMIDDYQEICFEHVSVIDALVTRVRELNPDAVDAEEIDYSCVERGMQQLEQANRIKLAPEDLAELIDAMGEIDEGSDDAESIEDDIVADAVNDEEIEPDDDLALESDEEERLEFVYSMFENYTNIIAIKRTLLEMDMFEDLLRDKRKTKARVVHKPTSIKSRDNKKDFSSFIKRRIKKDETFLKE